MVRSRRRGFGLTFLTLAGLVLASASGEAQSTHTSRTFTGAKVNAGTVTHAVQGGNHVLRLSSDFKVPDTPDPHWQVVDSQGNTFLLKRLDIKDKKVNTQIVLPRYVTDVATVQIYCAWAEVVLGETTFDGVLDTTN